MSQTNKSCKIILCDKCKGQGYLEDTRLINYHKSEYITHKINCKRCNNTGRLLETTTIETRPYEEEMKNEV